MDAAKIDCLQADLVPHRQWALRRWFYANPIWYYHRPSATHEICPQGKFYQLVDEDLREICRLLNDAGLRTTPSCQGHFYPRQRFERIWDELRKEEPQIRGEGLIVKDSENQQQYLFQNRGYRNPWPNFEAFYKEASAHQNVGYLGVIVPDDQIDRKSIAELRAYHSQSTTVRLEPELEKTLGGTVISVLVNTLEPQAQSEQWQRLTDHVRRVLESGQQLLIA